MHERGHMDGFECPGCHNPSGRGSEGAVCCETGWPAIACLEGTNHLEAGRLEEAEAAFEQAIRLAPASPEGYLGLAHVQSRLGREELAILLRARAAQLQEGQGERQPEEVASLEGDAAIPDPPPVRSPVVQPDVQTTIAPRKRAGAARTFPRWGAWAAAVLLSFIAIAAWGTIAHAPAGVVGTHLVSESDLRGEIHALALDLFPRRYLNRNTFGFDAEGWIVQHNAELQRLVLEGLLRREALRQLSAELGRPVGRREVAAALEELRRNPAWEQMARDKEWDAAEWRRRAELVALERSALMALPSPVAPSGAELEAYWSRNRTKFVNARGEPLSFRAVASYLRGHLALDRRYARLEQEVAQRVARIPTRFWNPVMTREVRQ